MGRKKNSKPRSKPRSKKGRAEQSKPKTQSPDGSSLLSLMSVIGRRTPFSDQDEVDGLLELFKGKSGHCARHAGNELIRGNIGTVVQIAKRYMGRGLPLEDLVQAGFIGLTRAISKYDRSKAKLNTYARFWIRSEIFRALVNDSASHFGYRVSHREFHKSRLVRYALAKLNCLNGGTLDAQQILDEIQRSEGKLNQEMTVEDVKRCLQRTWYCVSLEDQVFSDNEQIVLMDLVPCDKMASPEAACIFADEEESLEADISTLDSRERLILEMRFGRGGKEPCTLEEVGEYFEISRERARQLEVRALKKLGFTSQELKQFVVASEVVASPA